MTTIFLATDAIQSNSMTYMMHGSQRKNVREIFVDQTLKPLKAAGFKVIFFDNDDDGASGSKSHSHSARMERAHMDLIVSARARFFVHMSGSFGPGADSIPGCEGASAGSCFGNWIVHTRNSWSAPSQMLSAFWKKQQ